MIRSVRFAHTCYALVAAALCSALANADCRYSWVLIPNPPGASCSGRCINNRGEVAGEIITDGDRTQAFFWSPETGRVTLPFPDGFVSMNATCINDSGHIAGAASSPVLGWAAYLWDRTNAVAISAPAWADTVQVAGLTNDDRIVGTISGPQASHAFIWSSETGMIDLGCPPECSGCTATAMNEFGTIVGFAHFGPPPRAQAWIHRQGEYSWLDQPDEIESTRATSVNNDDIVVGHSDHLNPVQFYGLVWTAHSTEVLTAPSGWQNYARVRDINDAGRAVGFYGQAFTAPFVWQSGVVSDLHTLIIPDVPMIQAATAINNSGQILANGSGTRVLTPIWLEGDLTGDCHVSLDDLVIVLSAFGSSSDISFQRGDVNGDGRVDLSDIAMLLANWGA